MIASINRAVDDDAAIEADRLVHPLSFTESCARDWRVWRIGPRRKIRRIFVDVKLAVAASLWRRRQRHPRVFIPFVDFLSSCGHRYSPVISDWLFISSYHLRGFLERPGDPSNFLFFLNALSKAFDILVREQNARC